MATAKKQKASAPTAKRRGRRLDSKKRARNLQAAAEVKAEVYRAVEPIAQSLPPFKGEYTAELGEALADMVVEGATLDNIATLPQAPPMRFLLRWIRDNQHPFHKLYYDAKDAQVALFEERALQAALTPEQGTVKVVREVWDYKEGLVELTEVRHTDNVARSELKFKAYGWSLGWLRPKKHGKMANPDGGDKPNEQLNALFAALQAGPVKDEE